MQCVFACQAGLSNSQSRLIMSRMRKLSKSDQKCHWTAYLFIQVALQLTHRADFRGHGKSKIDSLL